MKGMIRVVLVDPREDSRQKLQRLLGSLSTVWLADVYSSYSEAITAVSEIVPDLIILSIDAHPEQALEAIRQILRVVPETNILPASEAISTEMLMRLMKYKVRGVLQLPTELTALVEHIKAAVSEAHEERSEAPKLIAITGASGGIGCTTVALNVASSLARNNPNQSVVLVDLDLLFGTVDSGLDIIPERTIMDLLKDVDGLDLPRMKGMLMRHESGLFVLPHPAEMEETTRIEMDALRKLIGMLKVAFDTVIIDCSKSLHESDFIAFQMADLILMVAQLDLNCLRNSARLLKLFRDQGDLSEKVRVVVNRSGSHFNEIGVKKAEEVLRCELLFQLPNDSRTCSEAMKRGQPIEVVAPRSPICKGLLEIAASLRMPTRDGAANENTITAGVSRRGRFAALF